MCVYVCDVCLYGVCVYVCDVCLYGVCVCGMWGVCDVVSRRLSVHAIYGCVGSV